MVVSPPSRPSKYRGYRRIAWCCGRDPWTVVSIPPFRQSGPSDRHAVRSLSSDGQVDFYPRFVAVWRRPAKPSWKIEIRDVAVSQMASRFRCPLRSCPLHRYEASDEGSWRVTPGNAVVRPLLHPSCGNIRGCGSRIS